MPKELLLRTPENDKSPLMEHLWHINDCDVDLYGLRISRVLREDRPNLEPVDVGVWPAERAYMEREGDVAIVEFSEARRVLLAELGELKETQLSRVGIRVDGSEINVLALIEQLAEHDRDHRWRIAAILKGYLLAV